MIEFIEDDNGIVADVTDVHGALAVSGFVGGDKGKYFRVDVPTNINSKEMLELFCRGLQSELKKVGAPC